jgi:hypothetical protein
VRHSKPTTFSMIRCESWETVQEVDSVTIILAEMGPFGIEQQKVDTWDGMLGP